MHVRNSINVLWTGSPLPSTSVRPKPLPRIKQKIAVPPIPVPRRSLTVVDPNTNITTKVDIETIPKELPVEKLETKTDTKELDTTSINSDHSSSLSTLSETSFQSDQQRNSKVGKDLIATAVSDKSYCDFEENNTKIVDKESETEGYQNSKAEIIDSNMKSEEISVKKPSLTSTTSVDSIKSLQSVDSLPTFLGSGNIKKWSNVQNLDGISVDSSMAKSDWSYGESDAGMFLAFY